MIRTQLFIRGLEMDITEDNVIPITYAIADIKQPEKRKRNSTKTIVLPGTRKNKLFFESSYNLPLADIGTQVGFNFDPTIRYPARIKEYGVETFRGSAHLQKVQIRANEFEFHVVLYSEIANLFQALGDLKVSELGWSQYDYVLNTANTVARFSPTLGEGVVIPLIDYGFTDDLQSYRTNELFPFLFIKEIIEKCFDAAGLSLSSTWLSSARVRKLIWGWGGGQKIDLSSTEVANRRANYTGDGFIQKNVFGTVASFSIMNFWSVQDYNIYDNPPISVTQVTDFYGQFNESNGLLTVFQQGDYKLNIQATCPITWAYVPAQAIQNFEIVVRLEIFKNGAKVAGQDLYVYETQAGSDTFAFDLTHEMSCNASDQIRAKFRIETFGSNASISPAQLQITFDLNNSLVMDFTNLNTGLVDGDTVNVSRFVPSVKASDFMLDMITMWNLYMEDPDREGVVKLEPAIDFYRETDDVDQWTELMARGYEHPRDISPASNIEGKTYEFHWAEDLDYYKRQYYEVYGTHYGDYDYEVPSTFKKGAKKYHIKTAQTCPVQIEGTDLIIPRIVKLNDANLQTVPYKGKPRMFFYNGLQPTTSTWILESTSDVPSVQVEYPQANHLDDLDSPTFDLNFGVPQWVFWDATAYTSTNLFQTYHHRFIKEITGRDSKLLTAYFKLDQSDLYKGFMRRLKNIDGVLYRVNKVVDYLANTKQLTQVELIKIVEADSIPTYGVPIKDGKEDLPNLGGVGRPFRPVDDNTEAKSNRSFYPVDTSGKDVSIELNADTLRKGWTGEFFKLNDANTVELRATGGGAIGTNINGEPTKELFNQYDSLTVTFDGQFFYAFSSQDTSTDHHAGFKLIEIYEEYTIEDEKQMVNHNKITNNGKLNINGDLILQ